MIKLVYVVFGDDVDLNQVPNVPELRDAYDARLVERTFTSRSEAMSFANVRVDKHRATNVRVEVHHVSAWELRDWSFPQQTIRLERSERPRVTAGTRYSFVAAELRA